MSSKYIKPPKHLKGVPEAKQTDIARKWESVEAVATAFNVLQEGSFKPSYLASVRASLVFLGKLHENMVEECIKHPDAETIPALKEEIEKRATKGKDDGKIEETPVTQ
jgi:hypothetical protein